MTLTRQLLSQMLFGLLASGFAFTPVRADTTMPVAQQNDLIHRHCEVCHTDAHLNGGMSLERYDAAQADPGLAAMLLSKITTGVPLKTVMAAGDDPALTVMILKRMDSGALRAAAIPMPDKATQIALMSTLAAQAKGAEHWTVSHGSAAPIWTAGVVREGQAAPNGSADIYHLTMTCGTETPGMVLAWGAGAPDTGRTYTISADGGAPSVHTLDAGEKMFKGAFGTMGTGAIRLTDQALPMRTLAIHDIFRGETIVFRFDDMARAARRQFAACLGTPVTQ